MERIKISNGTWRSVPPLTVLFAFGVGGSGRGAGEESVVSVVTDLTSGAAHGMSKILAALQDKGVSFEKADSLDRAKGKLLIVAGLTSGDGVAAKLLKAANKSIPQGPEALVICKSEYHSRPCRVIGGSDSRGLMYGELDAADRIGWSTDRAAPLAELREIAEKPAVTTRAVSIYTMNRAYWESRFYDEAYWARYLDTLARNRFNSVVLIFGYENGGFLAPCYPYFFDIEGFSDVRMVGISSAEQRRNLTALNRLIQMAHDRGLDFTVGIWDQGHGRIYPDLNQTTPYIVVRLMR